MTLVLYNHLLRSKFILTFIHDKEFRRAILYALNRGEHYNGLYRAISLLNNGELRGKSEIEMETTMTYHPACESPLATVRT